MRKKGNELAISVIIIAKNEEKKIGDCFESIKWADEIVLVDSGSTDKTKQIAKKYGARIFDYKGGGYSDWRNEGLKKAKEKWVLYVDADERVTPELRNEILSLLSASQNDDIAVYAIPRRNIILGKEMKYGGWWPDYVKRLYKKDKLKKWKGDLHEEPQYEGEMGHLESPLIHIKHNNLSEMVEKTNEWSEIEAKLLYDSRHPKMFWWRFFRIMGTELWFRLIIKQGFRDGMEGVIYSIYQMWSKFITYGKLWEMQLKTNNEKLITKN